MKLATWNCCLGLSSKKELISDVLKIKKIDILYLQETEIEKSDDNLFLIKSFNFESSKCNPKKSSCIYINENLN